MSIIEYLGIVIAPSLTLGLVIFLAKNWFLERLKNSIKHEYDLSLEKFKGDLKLTHDKELEDLKAILKKQTDVNLEDYRFQIEIRKKWLNDVREASSKYIDITRDYLNLFNQYSLKDKLALENTDLQFDNYKETLDKVGKLSGELSAISFKIDLLIFDCGIIGQEIKSNKRFISNWLRSELNDNFEQKKAIDCESEIFLYLNHHIKMFKDNVIEILESRSTKL